MLFQIRTVMVQMRSFVSPGPIRALQLSTVSSGCGRGKQRLGTLTDPPCSRGSRVRVDASGRPRLHRKEL